MLSQAHRVVGHIESTRFRWLVFVIEVQFPASTCYRLPIFYDRNSIAHAIPTSPFCRS